MNSFKIGDAVKIKPEFVDSDAAQDCDPLGVFIVNGTGLDALKAFVKKFGFVLSDAIKAIDVEGCVNITDDVGDLCGFDANELELVILD
jgi:hypothetical protein